MFYSQLFLPSKILHLSHILSLTSPVVALRSSLVSKKFLSASESDTVWCNFVPSGWVDIIAHSSSPIRRDQFLSEKEFFFHLCRFPVLLDNNTTSFVLDKWSGKICYMLGARALTITWGSTPQYWGWEAVPESSVEIIGKIHTTLLSPGSAYGAYFVFKINSSGSGLEFCPVRVTISEVSEDGLARNDHETKSFYLRDPEYLPQSILEPEIAREELPIVRDDGWMEIEMGRYQIGEHDECERAVLEMTLKEIDRLHGKNGLVVQGIEVRPL